MVAAANSNFHNVGQYSRVEDVYPYSHGLVTVVYLWHVSHYITYYTYYLFSIESMSIVFIDAPV